MIGPGKKTYERWQAANVQRALENARVTILSGARQTGKTTLARSFASEDAEYRDLDRPSQLSSALDDPSAFIKHDGRLMIVDEVQKVPHLLSAIKHAVDVDQRRGRFLLTGSAVIRNLPSVRESLAGRARTIRLRPLSQGEVLGAPPLFLERAFSLAFREKEGDHGHFRENGSGGERDRYLSLALAGGYPELLAQPDKAEREEWLDDYVSDLLSRDLQVIANIRRKDALKKLAFRLAAWSSKLVDLTKIGQGLEITHPTVESYINVMETMCLVDRVPAWVDTDYQWGRKRDKLFMADSGLMAGMLRWNFEGVRLDGDASGKLLETFVHNQLATLVDVHRREYELFHYRDRHGHEVDFVVRNRAGDVLGIEVKAATWVRTDDAKHLNWFDAALMKGRRFIGLVLHTGGGVHRRGENVWAVPIKHLWEGPPETRG